MAVTDRERQQAHELAKRQWATLADRTLVPKAQASQAIPVAGKAFSIDLPAAPVAPRAPVVKDLAAVLYGTIPWWARGERRVAHRLALAQAEQLTSRRQHAYDLAVQQHRTASENVRGLNEKAGRDHAAEVRLLRTLKTGWSVATRTSSDTQRADCWRPCRFPCISISTAVKL